ncbi:MAG: efflux RND transporter periplasmic adaptor subunit [Bacteroidales bacterium]|nr:efflux RND transporter periplasmic adaptor subunit [Candidatus Colimorpha onthohippi]
MNKLIGIFIAAIMLLVACSQSATEIQPRSCDIYVVVTDTISVSDSYPAVIQGRQDIDVLPQVSGKITKVCVTEGQHVRQGQTLFVVDQVPFQAALRSANADVTAAESAVEAAQIDLDSKQTLFNNNVISNYDLQMARSALNHAKAALEQAKAAQINAANNLSYTSVVSPANGVVGTLPFRTGSLVSPTMQQPLTTVSDNNEMFVYFSMAENRLRQLLNQYGSIDDIIHRMPPVQLRLNDGSLYDTEGHIASISGVINDMTGAISIRCTFDNPKQLLFSGSNGSIIIPHQTDNAIVVPQTAIFMVQDKYFAHKVKQGKAETVEVKIDHQSDGHRYIVLEGLSVGDTIVASGVGLIHHQDLLSY